MALPSGYEYADLLYRSSALTSSPYFDLGVVTSNTLNMDMLFCCTGAQANAYVFGARETNSTSSAKQLNLLYVGSSTSYLGYAGARLSLGTDMFADYAKVLQKEENIFTLNNQNESVHELTGATTVFTGTKNMFLFAMNNAGSPMQGSAINYGEMSFACIRMFSEGNMIHEFLPVYDYVNNKQCIYDTVNDSIIHESGSGDWTWIPPENISHHLLSIESDDGGYAYISTKTGSDVTRLYCHKVQTFNLNADEWEGTEVTAYEKNGYVFIGWEKDGSIISTERSIRIGIAADTVLKARFAKKPKDDPKNRNYLLCYKYGIDSRTSMDSFLAYTPIVNASIHVDGMSKTTSTIEVEEVPDGVMTNSIVGIRNPRGKITYIGIIKSIEDNTLTCREPLSIFDADFLFGSTKTSTKSLMKSLSDYMGSFCLGYPSYKNVDAEKNSSIERLTINVARSIDGKLSIEKNANMNITAPVIDDTNVSNLEDHLLKAFDEFGVYIKPYFYKSGGAVVWLVNEVTNPKIQSPLVLSNNSEGITDISVDVQEMENTSLVVYNSTGATFRGIYSVKTDGTITNYNYPPTDAESFIAYNTCKPKIIMSDDKIKTVVEQYLSSAQYNHKITFNLDLNSDLYSLDALNIGRRVEFYYKNKVYNSIVTGLEWELPENTEDPSMVKVTLGKVRNKLTTKINLGKIKK